MYNDIVMILLCIFAVYGVYAMLRELVILFTRQKHAVVAIRMRADMNWDACTDAIRIAERIAETNRRFEQTPVLLCDISATAEIQNYGYEVYVKQTGTEEECRRN